MNKLLRRLANLWHAFVTGTLWGSAPPSPVELILPTTIDYGDWHYHDTRLPLRTLVLQPPEIIRSENGRRMVVRGTNRSYEAPWVEGPHPIIDGIVDIQWATRPHGATHAVPIVSAGRVYWINWVPGAKDGFVWSRRPVSAPNTWYWYYHHDLTRLTSGIKWPIPFIRHVATVYGGGELVFAERPARHGNLINRLNGEGVNVLGPDALEHGFLHPFTRAFMSREEALVHAIHIGQVRLSPILISEDYDQLYSEDLWPDTDE